MSSKKSFELNSSSIEWFVRKLSCLACFAFFAFSFLSFSSSKEIKSSSSSNLFIINSVSSSSSSSFTYFSRRDFFFLFFFSCSINHISLIVFHSISKSWISCNNSTDIKRWFFVISLICLMRTFSTFRAVTSFACISSRFIRQIFINWALIRFFSSFFSFCSFATIACFAFSLVSFKLLVSNQQISWFNESQIICFES